MKAIRCVIRRLQRRRTPRFAKKQRSREGNRKSGCLVLGQARPCPRVRVDHTSLSNSDLAPERTRNLPNRNLNLSHKDLVVEAARDLGIASLLEK